MNESLETLKKTLDYFIGRGVSFFIAVPNNQTERREYTLKCNEINDHLGMVMSYFNETAPNFGINGEVLSARNKDGNFVSLTELYTLENSTIEEQHHDETSI